MANIKLGDLYLSKEESKDIIELLAKNRNIKNYNCSVESCVNKTIIWLYVCVPESLFNVSIVSRLI